MCALLSSITKSIRRENRLCLSTRFYSIATSLVFVYIAYFWIIKKIDVQYNYVERQPHLASDIPSSSHYIYYPESRNFEEMQQIESCILKSCNSMKNLWSDLHSHEFSLPKTSSAKPFTTKNEHLPYSKALFQSVDFPVLWLDSLGDVHWNEAAEREAYTYLMKKQFPSVEQGSTSEDLVETFIQDCKLRQLLILEQWRDGGFVSRLNCLIEQFGQSLYTPLMAILSPRKFTVKGAPEEDFLDEGIVGYISSISHCSDYLYHPGMSNTKEVVHKIGSDIPQQTKFLRIETFQQLRQRSNLPFLYLPEIWKFGYEHIPHRRWLFDFDKKRAIDFVSYASSKTALLQHTNEHIYRAQNIEFNLSIWEPNNSPFYSSKENLQPDYFVTWKDKVFTAFIRYMITLYVHRFPPRIQLATNLLSLHWTKYIGDKNRQPYNSTLKEMAGIFIRRGDKMPEDSFWKKHQHWRNISYYVKGLVDEEKKRNKTFSSIFIMTDDASVMNSILEYASTQSNASDEAYARRVLYRRQILYNVFAPQSCFNPFTRIGFDQFLVSLNFLVEHASFIVSHTDSNVGRYFERVIYAKRQIQGKKTFQTTSFVKNAPDSFD